MSNTTADKLNLLLTTKSNIKQAIINKGVSVSDSDTFASYATKIGQISGGGSTPVINSLNITPSTSSQTITASGGVDGYSPINVSAVDSSIDNNITAGNIKSGVNILGVTGSYSGSTVLTTKTITNNGTYNASSDNADGYSQVTVNVSGGGSSVPWGKEVVSNKLQLTQNYYFTCPSDIHDAGDYAFYRYFDLNPQLVEAYFNSLTSVSGKYAFQYAFVGSVSITTAPYSILEDADFSNVTEISGNYAFQYAFQNCNNLVNSPDFSNLQTISGRYVFQYAFANTSIVRMDFPSLSSIDASSIFTGAFNNCFSLTQIRFNSLTSSSFGTNSNQFDSMFNNNTGRDSGGFVVHFKDDASLETAIQGLTGYPNFGANSARITLAFDL